MLLLPRLLLLPRQGLAQLQQAQAPSAAALLLSQSWCCGLVAAVAAPELLLLLLLLLLLQLLLLLLLRLRLLSARPCDLAVRIRGPRRSASAIESGRAMQSRARVEEKVME